MVKFRDMIIKVRKETPAVTISVQFCHREASRIQETNKNQGKNSQNVLVWNQWGKVSQ